MCYAAAMSHTSTPKPPSDGDLSSASAYQLPIGKTEGTIATIGFHMVERILLLLVALMTIGGAVAEIVDIYQARSITLADILLMFLYTEVIGMVSVFYSGKGATFIYPIFIKSSGGL